MSLQSFVIEFLTFLEKREERLLSWGFYSVRWTATDIEAALLNDAPEALRSAWNEVEDAGHTVRSLLQQMQRRNLLYLVPGTIDAYRTRFAEGVRLLANLRQMFRESDWATGPRLVSDIKMHLTPRIYPRRNQAAGAVWQRLRDRCSKNDRVLLERCFYALAAKPGGGTFDFAGFQVRAFEHILENYAATGFTGSVISAGTSSGKTKAFYVPAFLGMVPELNGEPFTKVIAIYPRNVLLADQLREAIAEAEKLRPVLTAAGLRPIRFGALLGDTPYNWWFDLETPRSYHWKRHGNGAVIPYLKSPSDGRSELVWRDEDRMLGRTVLYRHGASEPDVPNGVLAMTREQMMADPPDVLFLSVEMLNREMGNPRWQRTFGMHAGQRSPRLMLLDEVHAHQGLPGAQVAWVLRRWRYWSKVPSLHVTGLSATLQDAAQHLARVAALSPTHVQEFRPKPGLAPEGEMEAEGVEYNLAVKGDPAAGASLLATSIQAGMLLARLLTPRHQAPSGNSTELRPEDFYRKKVFGFSDNLDSVNRWFSDMVDAEVNLRLAQFRALPNPTTPELIRRRRFQEGQVWELPIRLGHDLNLPLLVSRCSSQDPGADTNSDVIIATSALEVGFDDPEVAVVLHHKRPTTLSSFIQRKGRGGRTRIARPWTVVILSDYGGDRWAFQSAERLFLPEVDALALPIGNPYVIRVQMALFLIDWIGSKLGGSHSAFRYLQGPDSDPIIQQAQNQAANLLRAVLEQGPTWKAFREEFWRFFRRFSGFAEEVASQQLDDLLWHEPRPLLLQVIPTLLRKLETGWCFAYPSIDGAREDRGAGRPLPQSIPKATFAELDVGEAVLELEMYANHTREPQSMAVSRLLYEVCPGRVSKRFATRQGEAGYWAPYSVQLVAGENGASVADLFSQTTPLEVVEGVAIYQPDLTRVVHRPANVRDSSSASWLWKVLARSYGEGEALHVREGKPWRGVFSEANAFLHSNAESLEILRYAQECRFEVRRHKMDVAGKLLLRNESSENSVQPEAVGFRIRVDGLRFVIPPEHMEFAPQLTAEMLQRFRAEYFAHQLRCSPQLDGLLNKFHADWLSQVSMAMLTAEALLRGTGLAEAQASLATNRETAAQEVLDVIFQLRGINERGEEEEPRLQKALADLWQNPIVNGEIERLERTLWEPLDAEFDAWVRRRYVATLAQALRTAMISMAPQVSEDDLAVDIVPGIDTSFEILVTELSPGGLGQVEAITREIQRSPRRFLDALEHALSYCPRERIESDLFGVVSVAAAQSKKGGGLADAFDLVRGATSFQETEQAKNELCSALQMLGFQPVRAFVVAVITRLLRPSSSRTTDRLIDLLNRAWSRRSDRIGLAIPLRTFAFASVRHRLLLPILQNLFTSISGGELATPTQIFAQLQQLLLEPCRDSCPECLDQPGRFYDLGKPSRPLALAWLGLEIEEVSLDAHPDDWSVRANNLLRQNGRVRLIASESQRKALADGLPPLIATEIDLEALRVPSAITSVDQRGSQTAVIIQIPDFIHGQS